jgi:hypothetical protein
MASFLTDIPKTLHLIRERSRIMSDHTAPSFLSKMFCMRKGKCKFLLECCFPLLLFLPDSQDTVHATECVIRKLHLKFPSHTNKFLIDIHFGLSGKQNVPSLGTGATGAIRDVRWPMELLSCPRSNCLKNPNILPSFLLHAEPAYHSDEASGQTGQLRAMSRIPLRHIDARNL